MKLQRRTCELLGAHDGSGVLLGLLLLGARHLWESVKAKQHSKSRCCTASKTASSTHGMAHTVFLAFYKVVSKYSVQ